MIISEMQCKLATWSTADRQRKFDRLLGIMADRSWLAEAARITLASGGTGTPGIDGVDKQTMEAELPLQLERIRAELLAGDYQPLPARRVYIPKANGKFASTFKASPPHSLHASALPWPVPGRGFHPPLPGTIHIRPSRPPRRLRGRGIRRLLSALFRRQAASRPL